MANELTLNDPVTSVISFKMNQEDFDRMSDIVTSLQITSGVDLTNPGAFTIRNHSFSTTEPGAFTIRNHSFSAAAPGAYTIRNFRFSVK